MTNKLQTTYYTLPTSQSGQTLIETIIAIFILVTALTAAAGVSIYAISSSANNFNQIVATNLAREGIEVIRMMRDSNWLASDAKAAQGNPTYDLQACNDIGGRPCFPRAYDKIEPFNVFDLGAGAERLNFDLATRSWTITGTNSYYLYLQNDGSYNHNDNGTAPIFARMIYLVKNSSSPYSNQNSNYEKSAVVWNGKNCTTFTASTDIVNNFNTRCRVLLEEHLTNWKDYK
jgi:Tfp pilus assembly protein PilV